MLLVCWPSRRRIWPIILVKDSRGFFHNQPGDILGHSELFQLNFRLNWSSMSTSIFVWSPGLVFFISLIYLFRSFFFSFFFVVLVLVVVFVMLLSSSAAAQNRIATPWFIEKKTAIIKRKKKSESKEGQKERQKERLKERHRERERERERKKERKKERGHFSIFQRRNSFHSSCATSFATAFSSSPPFSTHSHLPPPTA